MNVVQYQGWLGYHFILHRLEERAVQPAVQLTEAFTLQPPLIGTTLTVCIRISQVSSFSLLENFMSILRRSLLVYKIIEIKCFYRKFYLKMLTLFSSVRQKKKPPPLSVSTSPTIAPHPIQPRLTTMTADNRKPPPLPPKTISRAPPPKPGPPPLPPRRTSK